MNCDCAIYTGKAHSICEDYARVIDMNECSYAIISDGCSSSKDSDVGSRILSLCIEKVLKTSAYTLFYMCKNGGDYELNHIKYWLKSVNLSRINMGLKTEAIDATLILAEVDTCKNRYCIKFFGDGVAAIGFKDGSIDIVSIEYPSGYPFFINYYLDEGRFKQWMEYANDCTLKKYSIIENKCKIHCVSCAKLVNNISSPYLMGSTKNLKFISIMSDGVSSFSKLLVNETSKTTKNVPLEEVLPRILAFKNYQGEFVKRRLQRFLKDIKKDSWQHNDDLSMATIHVGD